jgi:threonine/homoserine/homoserine lactone efflux protein
MSPGHVLAFALVAFALIVIPGPSVLFVIGRALALGKRSALETVVGNAAGQYVQLTAVALGVGAIVQRSVAVFTAVKLIGAAYLVFLGVRAIRNRHSLAAMLDADRPLPSRRRILREGFVVGVTNPKSLAFFVAVLPQFVDPSAGPVFVQLMLLGLVWVAVAIASTAPGRWSPVRPGVAGQLTEAAGGHRRHRRRPDHRARPVAGPHRPEALSLLSGRLSVRRGP